MVACSHRRNEYVLPTVWFMAGFSRALPSVAMRMLIVNEMQIQPYQQAVLGVWGGLPWNLKIFAAFLSDSVPVCGRRRIPYLTLGLALQLIAFSALASGRVPSVGVLGSLDCMQAMGMVWVGTMSDTLIVESMKRDSAGSETFGNLQTHCWISMFVGSLIGNLISGHVHLALGTSGVFGVTAVLKLTMLALPMALCDPGGHRLACAGRRGCATMRREILDGASSARVWRPILFLFIFAACPQNGDAWNSFLYGMPTTNVTAATANAQSGHAVPLPPLNLPEATLGYVNSVTTIAQVAGACFYPNPHPNPTPHPNPNPNPNPNPKPNDRTGSGRLLLPFLPQARAPPPPLRPHRRRLVSTATHAAHPHQPPKRAGWHTGRGVCDRRRCHLGGAWGGPPFLTSLTLLSIAHFGDTWQVTKELLAMPMLVLMASLCPDGAASTVFALLTSVQMAGSNLSGSLSSALTRALAVDLDDYSNLWKLTVACSAVRLSTLCCIALVPDQTPSNIERGSEERAARGLAQQDGGVEGVGAALAAGHGTHATSYMTSFLQIEHPQNHARAPSSRNRHPYFGAVLLFSLIGASLVWSLTSMFSNL